MDKLIRIFTIIDELGDLHKVGEWQKYHDASSFDGGAKIPGLKELTTQTGLDVNYVSEGNYFIVSLGRKAKIV